MSIQVTVVHNSKGETHTELLNPSYIIKVLPNEDGAYVVMDGEGFQVKEDYNYFMNNF